MFLPVGHDQGLRHFPWLTVMIMAACLLVQLHQSIFGGKQSDLIQLLEETAKIEETAVLTYRKDEVNQAVRGARNTPGDREAQQEAFSKSIAPLVESFRSGEMTGTDNVLYQKWLEHKQREQDMRSRSLSERLAYRPADRVSWTLLGYAFAHAGWFHLIGNMLFLYLVGCNLEDRWGRAVFAGMYAGGAVVSALVYGAVHQWAGPGMVGASGAVATGMGAFLICFYRARIQFLTLVGLVTIRAFWALPVWFLLQVAYAATEDHGSAVAYSAHAGGFVFGVLLAVILRVTAVEKRWLLPATAKGVEWHEDPSFLRALDLIQRGCLSAAVALLQDVVKKNPRHEAAWDNLAQMGIRLSDARLTNSALCAYLGLLPRNRLPTVAAMLRETCLLDSELKLDDRTLFMLLRATDAVNDGATGMQIVQRLLADFPQSPYLPRALWEMARLQEAAGQPDLASATLNDLIKRFPHDTFAQQAEDKLNGAKPVSPSVVPPLAPGPTQARPVPIARREHQRTPIAVPQARPDDPLTFEIERPDEQPSHEVAITELPGITREAWEIPQNAAGAPEPSVPATAPEPVDPARKGR